MYACIPEIVRGFFGWVCTPSNAIAHSYDPPPLHHTKEPEPPRQGSGPKRVRRHSTVSGDLAWGRGKPSLAQCPSTARKSPTHHAEYRVHTPLKASRAGTLLIGGIPSCSSHDLMP
jgi:hypothetical protein